MPVVTPEGWYIAFWLVAGAIALVPIYVLLWLIYRALTTTFG